jgi:hypothetical protein
MCKARADGSTTVHWTRGLRPDADDHSPNANRYDTVRANREVVGGAPRRPRDGQLGVDHAYRAGEGRSAPRAIVKVVSW